MASNIDPTKPTTTQAFTADVRANFAAAASEITALQTNTEGAPFLPTSGGEIDGELAVAGDITAGSIGAETPGPATFTSLSASGPVTLPSTTTAPFLSLNGGMMGGLITLSGPPTLALHASTKAYVDGALSLITTPLVYRGGWDPTVNTNPALATGGLVNGAKALSGDMWLVTKGGTTAAIDGITTWNVNDWAVSNGSVWQHAIASGSAYLPLIGGQLTGPLTLAAGATYLDALTSAPALTVRNDGSAEKSLNFLDAYGGIIMQIGSYGIRGGTAVFQNLLASSIPGAKIVDDHDPTVAFRLVAGDGVSVLFQVNANTTVYSGPLTAASGSGGTSNPTVYSATEIAERNSRALALSTVEGTDTLAARAVWGINVVFSYGQSLMVGFEGWPRLTKTSPFDNLMIGQSVRTTGAQGAGAPTTWTPIGDTGFHPMTATVQDVNTGAPIDDATAAGLAPGDASVGESIDIGALNFWRRQQLNLRGLATDPSRRLLSVNCGVGGRTVAQLSKGASPALFNRLTSAATAVKTTAAGATLSAGAVAMLYCQGENDYVSGTSVAAYKTSLAQLRSDFVSDVQVGIFNQTISGTAVLPAMFTYQPGPAYVTETVDVAEALLELSQEQNSWYLVGPVYPVTDKNGHLDPNGYRWMGMQFGKVLHRVIDFGEAWKPLSPIQMTARHFQVLVDFYVPSPPIVFDKPYVATTATDYAAKGFWVTDDSGDVNIVSIAIVSDTQVLITLQRTIVGTGWLSYGKKTPYNGEGNLRDSDPTLADTNYEYTAGTGQYAAANIPTLVAKPYPLWNWCVNFRRTITAES